MVYPIPSKITRVATVAELASMQESTVGTVLDLEMVPQTEDLLTGLRQLSEARDEQLLAMSGAGHADESTAFAEAFPAADDTIDYIDSKVVPFLADKSAVLAATLAWVDREDVYEWHERLELLDILGGIAHSANDCFDLLANQSATECRRLVTVTAGALSQHGELTDNPFLKKIAKECVDGRVFGRWSGSAKTVLMDITPEFAAVIAEDFVQEVVEGKIDETDLRPVTEINLERLRKLHDLQQKLAHFTSAPVLDIETLVKKRLEILTGALDSVPQRFGELTAFIGQALLGFDKHLLPTLVQEQRDSADRIVHVGMSKEDAKDILKLIRLIGRVVTEAAKDTATDPVADPASAVLDLLKTEDIGLAMLNRLREEARKQKLTLAATQVNGLRQTGVLRPVLTTTARHWSRVRQFVEAHNPRETQVIDQLMAAITDQSTVI